MPDACDCFAEVARLHQFFQDWFRGEIPEAAFAMCAAALAPGFALVTPSGELIGRDEILAGIERHYGAEPNEFAIEIVERSCRRVNDVHLVTYEEHHLGPRPSIRLSTAALTRTGDEYSWHAVHETWVTVQ